MSAPKRARVEGGGMNRVASMTSIGAFGGSNSALADQREGATDDVRVKVNTGRGYLGAVSGSQPFVRTPHTRP